MRIVEATDKRAMRRLLTPPVRAGRAFDRRVRAIVDAVRAGGDRALTRFARRFDGVAPPLEVSASDMRGGANRVETTVRRALAQAASHIARVAFRQIPRHWDLDVAPGVTIEQRVEPLA